MSIFPVVQTVENHNSQCMLSVYDLGDPYRALRGIFLFLVVVNYLTPLSVISVLYTITARRLWFHVAPGGEHFAGNREQLETSKRRVVKMLIVVTCAFALCWLPAQVVHVIIVMQAWNVEVTLQPNVMFLCFWFGHANSAINAWLYISLRIKISTAFTRIANRKSSRSPPSLSVKTSNAFLPPEEEAVQDESKL
ncbi:allatostatin-A receptor-like [Stylophora pistillata]|uniref:allatostatin-A receptor-like n=1 Tax=Stylophora pistillata TaxID=50429 RepID=UPI000C04DEC3|nr:allatostatin-A receptor-like [Stylophora pistillata]